MSRPVSHATVISAIVRKDLAEYGRDRLWAFLTVLVLVVVVVLFWILPTDVNETVTVGVAGLDDGDAVAELASSDDEGLATVPFSSEDDLRAVVAGDADAWTVDGETVVIPLGADRSPPDGAIEAKVAIGLAFPEDFVEAAAAGQVSQATVYVAATVPDEVERAMSSLVREIGYAAAGEPLPIDTSNPTETFVVLGEDRVGDQASIRDGFRPIMVFLILMMEMFVMASLIAKEIQDRTVTAMLVTPATIGDVLAAKGLAGAASGLAQAVIVLIAIDSLAPNPLLILTLVLLGAILISGTAMIVGSSGRDFISTLFYGMAYMVPLLIPAFAALFPGTAAAWVRILPSYPLVRGLVDVTTYGAGWSDTLPQLAALSAWCVALFGLGWMVLRRKVQTL
jgi:ABC-2 type transport system permease protein